MGFSIIVIGSPIGEPVHGCTSSRFPVSLSGSAPLREIFTAWIRLRRIDAVKGSRGDPTLYGKGADAVGALSP